MKDMHVIENLPILVLYPHNRCNCRCVMCDIWKLDAVVEIGISELERHASDIENLRVRWVVFSGGEPLMHRDLFLFSDFLRARGIRTTILSTGILLALKARDIARSVDDVIVSLDGPAGIHDRIRRVPGAFGQLADGVRAVRSLKPDLPVAARTTVQHANFSVLRETVETAQALGLQSISFLAADLTSKAFNRPAGWPPARQAQIALTERETAVLETEIEELIKDLPKLRGFVLESPEKLRRIVLHFRAHLGLAEPRPPRCNAPWVSAVVESDGSVRPCFFHEAVGNLKEGSLRGILNGPRALEFRRALDIATNPVCARCVCSLHLGDAGEQSQIRRTS